MIGIFKSIIISWNNCLTHCYMAHDLYILIYLKFVMDAYVEWCVCVYIQMCQAHNYILVHDNVTFMTTHEKRNFYYSNFTSE